MDASRQEEIRAGTRVTLVGLVANACLIAAKLAGGVLGHSQALVADAVHSVSDLLSDLFVLLGIRAGRQAADPDHPFGHARIETVVSSVVGLSLVAAALFLGIEAGRGIYEHVDRHPTPLALVVAGLSVVVKEWLYRYTRNVGKRIRSTAIIANAWHHRSDALSSVAVLLGVAGASIRKEWHILDSFAALVVSFFIITVGARILRDAIRELTDTAPGPEVLDRIEAAIRGAEGVVAYHDLKVRTSGGLYQMELHVVVDGSIPVEEGHRIAKRVEARIREGVEDVSQVITHVDPARRGTP